MKRYKLMISSFVLIFSLVILSISAEHQISIANQDTSEQDNLDDVSSPIIVEDVNTTDLDDPNDVNTPIIEEDVASSSQNEENEFTERYIINGKLGNVPYRFDQVTKELVFDGTNVKNARFPDIETSAEKFINRGSISVIEFRGDIKTGALFHSFFSETQAELVGLNNLDVTNTWSFQKLFYNYQGPTDLSVVSSWNVTGMENANSMFEGTGNPNQALSLQWGEKTSRLYYADSMFQDSQYSQINDINSWDVSNLESTKWMFRGAKNIKEIDLSWGKGPSRLIIMEGMFENAVNLESVRGTGEWELLSMGYTGAPFSYADNFLRNTKVKEFYVPQKFNEDPSPYLSLNIFNGANALEKIIVPQGNDTDFMRYSNLPQVESGNGFIGYWSKEEDQSIQWSSNDFINNYGAHNPKAGTYYKVRSHYNVNYYVERTEGQFNFDKVASELVEANQAIAEYPSSDVVGIDIYGWYTDEKLTQVHNKEDKVRSDLNLYAGRIDISPRTPINPFDASSGNITGDTIATNQEGLLQLVSVPSPLIFGQQNIGQGIMTYESLCITPNVQVFNHPKQAIDWDLSVAMTPFSSKNNESQNHKLNGILSFENTHSVNSGANSDEINYESSFRVFSDNRPVKIASSDKRASGQWAFGWFGKDSKSNSNVTLEIDTHKVMPTQYESNIEWILSSVPN